MLLNDFLRSWTYQLHMYFSDYLAGDVARLTLPWIQGYRSSFSSYLENVPSVKHAVVVAQQHVTRLHWNLDYVLLAHLQSRRGIAGGGANSLPSEPGHQREVSSVHCSSSLPFRRCIG